LRPILGASAVGRGVPVLTPVLRYSTTNHLVTPLCGVTPLRPLRGQTSALPRHSRFAPHPHSVSRGAAEEHVAPRSGCDEVLTRRVNSWFTPTRSRSGRRSRGRRR
jgi:hypothetical protein